MLPPEREGSHSIGRSAIRVYSAIVAYCTRTGRLHRCHARHKLRSVAFLHSTWSYPISMRLGGFPGLVAVRLPSLRNRIVPERKPNLREKLIDSNRRGTSCGAIAVEETRSAFQLDRASELRVRPALSLNCSPKNREGGRCKKAGGLASTGAIHVQRPTASRHHGQD